MVIIAIASKSLRFPSFSKELIYLSSTKKDGSLPSKDVNIILPSVHFRDPLAFETVLFAKGADIEIKSQNLIKMFQHLRKFYQVSLTLLYFVLKLIDEYCIMQHRHSQFILDQAPKRGQRGKAQYTVQYRPCVHWYSQKSILLPTRGHCVPLRFWWMG